MGAHSEEFAIQRGKLLTPTFWVLAVIVAIGFYFVGVRFVYGLASASNLSQGFPWGVWITYDVATGTAFACGGYAIAIITYIMNQMQYHPLIRSAILTSLFGYMFAGLSVVVDTARYWRLYNFFVPSAVNGSSVMLEVALCVTAYNLVLMIEFMPALMERLKDAEYQGFWRRFEGLANWCDKAYPKLVSVLIFIVCLGITLPTMHQSSLGSLMIIAGVKLHPLWQTGWLPLLFLLNAFYLGFAIVVFESIASSHFFGRPYERNELAGISRFAAYGVAVWFLIRIYDLIARGALGSAFAFGFYAFNFWGETLCLGIGGVLLWMNGRTVNLQQMFLAAVVFLVGGGWYRFNAYIIGYTPATGGYRYFPSLAEFMITLGFIAFEVLLYITLVKLLPLLSKPHTKAV